MSRPALVVIVTLTLFVIRPAAARGAIAGAERKDAYTQHDEIRAKLDFNRRTLAKSYEQVGTRDPKWDDAALEFLDAIGLSYSYSGHNMIYMPGPVPSPAHLEKLGKTAVDAGCDDPLVLYCYGSILYDMKKEAQAKPVILKAADGLAGSKYPAIRIANGHRQAINLLDQERDADAIAKHRTAGRAAALRAATGKFEPHDQQVVFPIIADHPGAGLNDRRAFYNDLRKLPDADPWIVNMVGGDYHIDAAWALRGGGWAQDVTEEGWRGFNSNLKQARDCFLKAHELHPDYARAASRMITVAMGAGEELNLDPREWFDKATSAQVDHIGAYSRYRNTLLPRWGGSYKAMHDFAMECAGTDRYDTLVPYEYIETVYSVIRDSGRDDLWAHEPTFQQAKTILTRYAERHPSQMSPYLSHVAGIAWEGGHYAEAKSILDRLGDKLDMSFIEYFAPLPKLAIDQVHAMTSPLKAKITAAEAFLENEDVAGAVKAYDAMLTNAADEPGARYVLARRNELDLWHRAEKEWVSLKPDKHLTGWHPTGGEWSVDDDGRLVCTMGKAQETIIVYPADPGRAYEMRCRVEYELSPGTKPSAGPVVAYAGRNRRYGMYVSLRGELLVKSGATYLEPFKMRMRKENDVHVIVWENSITTIVNGSLAKQDYRIRNDVPAEGTYFGLGAYWAPPGAVVYFSDIQVRRLHEAPGQ